MPKIDTKKIIESNKIILFDAECKLCSAWCNFMIKHDKKLCFKLCSVQSSKGQAILKYFNYPTDSFKTMLYIEKSMCTVQSDAFIDVVIQLGWPWRMAKILRIIPKRVRNWAYDRIAFNRYALFGKYDYCLIPNADYDQHYL
ncbi:MULTISPECIES: thiol-disulfide oxidoreductase DCC family protein [unclassified Pseudoalteromonas]|uniref:thiol-disulfide oxidoreductase DCC family protein n=1 Tax=unclassified Pseudoalteromonas TaxID=194690 RepID=UPI0014614454|nr:DCC1-like thiol-disulfide oxidoreductase family protein [Pseudoalteromonas sp. NEC-BIFX-2020_015]NMR27517.1 DUF393 domain-containing protein [Pseudoalteromonas sp. NEC-BIFX-2020_015]